MKLSTLVVLTGVLLLLASVSAGYAASPIQLALVPSVQLVPESQDVAGIRLSIWGRNASLTGLDFGFVNQLTGPSVGFQKGLVNHNESDFSGWQEGFINMTDGNFLGLQDGFINISKDATGLQAGIVNKAGSMSGIQFGVLNFAQTMNGLQIGFINFIETGGQFPVFPIVNWSF